MRGGFFQIQYNMEFLEVLYKGQKCIKYSSSSTLRTVCTVVTNPQKWGWYGMGGL